MDMLMMMLFLAALCAIAVLRGLRVLADEPDPVAGSVVGLPGVFSFACAGSDGCRDVGSVRTRLE